MKPPEKPEKFVNCICHGCGILFKLEPSILKQRLSRTKEKILFHNQPCYNRWKKKHDLTDKPYLVTGSTRGHRIAIPSIAKIPKSRKYTCKILDDGRLIYTPVMEDQK